MKTIDLRRPGTPNPSKIVETIGKKLKETRDKIESKVDLGKIAEKMAERRERVLGGDKKEE